MRQLDYLLPLLLLFIARQHRQRIIRALQQLLLIAAPHLIVIRPIHNTLIYPLQRALPIDLSLNLRRNLADPRAQTSTPLANLLIDPLLLLLLDNFRNTRIRQRRMWYAAFKEAEDGARREVERLEGATELGAGALGAGEVDGLVGGRLAAVGVVLGGVDLGEAEADGRVLVDPGAALALVQAAQAEPGLVVIGLDLGGFLVRLGGFVWLAVLVESSSEE